MNDRNIKTSIFSIKPDKLVREHKLYSEPLLGGQTTSNEEALVVSNAILVAPKTTASKSINWKYIALAVPILAAFFLMIKVVSEPVEPIIIMDEPATNLHIATAPEAVASVEAQNPPALPDSVGNDVLSSNESIETLPLPANLPAEIDAEKNVATIDTEKNVIKASVATIDKSPQELLAIDFAKKKAKQKAKKKTEEAMQHNLTEAKLQAEIKLQQTVVVPQKELAVMGAEAKKDTLKEAAKEVMKTPVQEKSGWSKLTDSIKQGGQAPCSPAQIAMNQCS